MNAACMIVLVSIFPVCVLSFPVKPLNERSTELAWEAWLLVDQSNRQSDLGMLRRRITPKSVFIAPTFSPESLPACAEGYKSDPMGRCVKIYKIDPSGHFDFLLQKLNAQFSDYEDTTESATHGPLQLNIPLFAESDEKMLENETEVAIVVTPTKGHRDHHHHRTSVKVDVKRNGETFDLEDVASILGVKPEDVEMTTIAEFSTTIMSTTLRDDEVTTIPTTTEFTTTELPSSTTTEIGETSTFLDGDALFFQV